MLWVEGERLGGVDLFFLEINVRISPPKIRKVITKATLQYKLRFMLAEVRGYTSESINCPEGTADLKVWETLLYINLCKICGIQSKLACICFVCVNMLA